MDNLNFASKLPLRSLHLSMVVQQNNYQQMIAFCHMARSLGARAHFSLLRHWNSFSDDEFKLRQVAAIDHPEHLHFLSILQDSIFLDNHFDVSELRSFDDFK